MFVPPSSIYDMERDTATPGDKTYNAATGRCPIDRAILVRTTLELGSEDRPLHLERCSSCRGVWFDAGEWSILSEQHLLDHLDEFWTAEWRAQQRKRASEERFQQRLREEFGPELYDALQQMAARLRSYERRSQALAFLREASEE